MEEIEATIQKFNVNVGCGQLTSTSSIESVTTNSTALSISILFIPKRWTELIVARKNLFKTTDETIFLYGEVLSALRTNGAADVEPVARLLAERAAELSPAEVARSPRN